MNILLQTFYVQLLIFSVRSHIISPDQSPQNSLLKTITNIQAHSHSRLLATEAPHPLRIYGDYLNKTLASPSIDAIRLMFGVATKYYENVLKVNYLPTAATKFRP